MISFDLACAHQHRFEGWFSSSRDYDAQLADGLLLCPLCGDAQISKVLSAPNIGRKGNQRSTAVVAQAGQEVATVSNAPQIPPAIDNMLSQLADMQRKILKDSQWVGRDFAEEARAIHYGETGDRLIHGETSPEEAEALADEGVSVAPLLFPYVPDAAKN